MPPTSGWGRHSFLLGNWEGDCEEGGGEIVVGDDKGGAEVEEVEVEGEEEAVLVECGSSLSDA